MSLRRQRRLRRGHHLRRRRLHLHAAILSQRLLLRRNLHHPHSERLWIWRSGVCRLRYQVSGPVRRGDRSLPVRDGPRMWRWHELRQRFLPVRCPVLPRRVLRRRDLRRAFS